MDGLPDLSADRGRIDKSECNPTKISGRIGEGKAQKWQPSPREQLHKIHQASTEIDHFFCPSQF
ncbi:MAG: hypothetical protein A3F82_05800 [Deltaproteobacteria bacterium RIFCSPLOWO2_12_FULL_44_12]|nr:MAG: hypothetical protein A2712_01505 [Deltaproteobacteria bacterium RIFCSPHIGHO2_01_FULL_43_49]OGQ15193.1 MAG: hypothetical protein A3D22_03970 [Deltaproteobacteria bacterium RIFCSPHIGHO2_02_FULL_44_53]OGQ27185.1 MAG: hypothetical protein A3D98_02095 [Deltaproteobacteria bacterium RIFCSPHIGHO2_12_FULL_44_21]OGQ31710.1 MAG: hypothetical protein A2979_05130 [Deltaproteobacteria bacterium RIFCSPLOWO2_01_FULL_45_74]OGQ69947.1 MAG: hypothetical protein A3F82_05800 [Deltaproteobacteria bacterium 